MQWPWDKSIEEHDKKHEVVISAPYQGYPQGSYVTIQYGENSHPDIHKKIYALQERLTILEKYLGVEFVEETKDETVQPAHYKKKSK
jgi:hypothetical protein